MNPAIIAIAIVTIIIIIYIVRTREHYGVCLDCKGNEIRPFGFVINPFIWPYSADADVDKIRAIVGGHSEPLRQGTETFSGGPDALPGPFPATEPTIDTAMFAGTYNDFTPDHPPVEGRS